jgi:hypothetical protein
LDEGAGQPMRKSRVSPEVQFRMAIEGRSGKRICGGARTASLLEYCLRYHASISSVDLPAFAARSPVSGWQ